MTKNKKASKVSDAENKEESVTIENDKISYLNKKIHEIEAALEELKSAKDEAKPVKEEEKPECNNFVDNSQQRSYLDAKYPIDPEYRYKRRHNKEYMNYYDVVKNSNYPRIHVDYNFNVNKSIMYNNVYDKICASLISNNEIGCKCIIRKNDCIIFVIERPDINDLVMDIRNRDLKNANSEIYEILNRLIYE